MQQAQLSNVVFVSGCRNYKRTIDFLIDGLVYLPRRKTMTLTTVNEGDNQTRLEVWMLGIWVRAVQIYRLVFSVILFNMKNRMIVWPSVL